MRFLNNILAKAGLIVDGTTQLNTIANATIDTDKFLVSDGGVIKYRTGAQLGSDIGAANLAASTLKHQVKLGEAINKGQAVYVSSADGTNMIVSKASNASEATSSKTLGLIETSGVLNDQVNVVTEGLLAGLDTSTAAAGDPVWLGTNGNIIFGLPNKPYAPAHLVFIGIVTRVQQNNGEIFVKVQNGFELKEIHDVQITTTPSDNTVLAYESATSLYKMKSIATLLGYTPANAARQLTINGTTYDLTADRTWNVGTVTSVGVSVPTGLSVSGTPVTGSGTIAIALAAGYSIPTTASQANWDTAYANRITSLTTTGTSGAATLTSNTLNIPIYQAQGNYITSLTGEATASGPGAASVTLTNSAVIGKVLTGLNVTGGTIVATDSILTAFGKVQNQINGLMGGVVYQGTWNASTNSPTLTSSSGTKGYYYIVTTAGSTNLDGITDWKVGDWAIFNGSTWNKVDNTDAVVSVNGQTGAVSLTTSNISEGTNLYYTDARARAAISLTTTGSSGAATYSSSTGVLNVPQYTLAGLGGVPTSRQLTINGTAYDLSADRSWSVGTVTSVAATAGSGISISGSPITSSGTLTITNTGVLSVNGSTGAVTGIATTAQLANYLPLSGGTMTGLITSNVTDEAFRAQSNGTSTAWRGRLGSFNSTADKSSFLGNYTGRPGVFGHNNALTAWAELYVNTLGIYGQGDLYLSWFTYVKGNGNDTNYPILHSGNYNSYAPTLTGGGASGTWGINITGTAGSETLATVTGRGASTSSDLTFNGTLTMGTGGTQYIRMGRFPASVTNTGEAWIGRASDRNSGTMTVQLGGNSASGRQFEVVDYAWSVVLLNVSSGGDVTASGSMRAPIFYDSQNTAYYLDPASTSRLNAINYDNLYFAGDTTYGLYGRNAYLDTINGRGTDPLELNYYDGGPVKIGTGVYGSKDLYASMVYVSGGNAVIHAGNIGSQSVSYASSAGNADTVDGYHAAQTYTSTGNVAGSFLGGHYSSGGTEKPNSATFGAGKLKIAMLSGSNLGFGGSWNDVIWVSAYSGGDVKSSHALVFDKYSSNVWVSDQNFDSASWGTGYLLLHSGNYNSYSPTLTGGGASGTWGINITGSASSATNADTVDGYHATNAASGLAYYASNGYLYVPSWINVNGGGIFASTNNAHLRPNTGSYGAWEMIGSKNGWAGIWFNDSSDYLMANNNEVGHYQHAVGWKFRWYQGTMYVSRGTTGGGTEYTVLDSGNFNSWAAAVNGNVSNTFNVLQLSYASTAFNPSAAPRTTMSSMSVKMWNNYFNGTGLGSDYGTVMQYYSLSGHVDSQVYFDAGGGSWYRTASYNSGWQSWQKYVTENGGTWGINITGNAGYASSAGNADTVDGYHASTSTIGNYIVVRDGNGYIFGNYINMTDDGNPGGGTAITSFITKQGDNYYRSVSPTNAMVSIRGVASGTWGINITGSAGSTSLLTALGNYVWSASTLPSGFNAGIQTSFVSSSQGFLNYGSVITNRTYTGSEGGTLQLYTPYSPTYGGTRLAFRSGNYDNGAWTGWKYLLNSDSDPYAYNMNQYVRTSDAVTFTNVYNYGWFRNYNSNEGLYNQSTTQHWSSNTNGYWDASSTTSVSSIRFYTGGHVSSLRGYVYANNGNEIGFLSEDGNWVLRTWNRGVEAYGSMRAPIFYDSNDTTYYADFNNTGRSMYTAGYLQSSGMIMKGSAGGGQIYPTISNGGVSLYGGNNLTNGAYFTVTGIDYGSSPGAGSAEFVIRSEASSKFAMFSYNGSTWTGRYSLWGSTGNVTIGSATTDYGVRLAVEGDFYASSTAVIGASIGYSGYTLNVGLDSTTNGSIYAAGDIYASGNITAYSDARVKKNIRSIDNALERVIKSRGILYDRSDIDSVNNIGFIAQELEEQFPELVSTDQEGKKGVMYQNMVAVLVEAIKDQQKMIDELKAKLV